MKFSCLVFDVDGTLAKNANLIYTLFKELFLKFKNQEITIDDLQTIYGPPAEEIFAKHFPDEKEEVMSYYLTEYEKKHSDIGYFSQNELDRLKEKYLLTIFTGKGRQGLDITLRKLNLTNFDYIVCGSDLSRSKPHPDGLLKIINHFQLEKESVLMLGDSPLDVYASRAAGIKVAGALWGTIEDQSLKETKPDYLFETPEEFLEWLGVKA